MTDRPGSPEMESKLSFDAVFHAQFGYVWNTLRRLGVREGDAMDQAQEVFVVVHEIWSDYDPARPLRPWLFGIAYRIASRYRALARHRREVADDGAATTQLADPAPRADEALAQNEARDLLLRALDELDLGRRAVVVMHLIDERPIPEVAEALQIPVNTAYSPLRVGREELEKALERLAKRGKR